MKKVYLLLTITILFFQQNSNAQVLGCTDILATNYNKNATKNDGSCTYNAAQIAPLSSYSLNGSLAETSGLIKWNNQIWTHNDDTDLKLYALDTNSGNIVKSYSLNGLTNTDWEDISQDENYVYIGDFGNNSNGNRTDLKIIRVEKNSLLANSPLIDTIRFNYNNQTDFSAQGANNTDFDCESFIVSGDSIFLFTKQWINKQTSLYAFPKTPGTHTANYKTTFNVQGLITGAVNISLKNLTVLCGYTNTLQPFLYLLYDYKGTDFFSGNKRRVDISLPFYQIEGIASNNGLNYFLSNEYFTKPPIVTTNQKLHVFNLNNYLGHYLNPISTLVVENEKENNFQLFPNPVSKDVSLLVTKKLIGENYTITAITGKTVITNTIYEEKTLINCAHLPPGIYWLSIGNNHKQAFKLLKN